MLLHELSVVSICLELSEVFLATGDNSVSMDEVTDCLSVLEEEEADVLVHDGKYGPSVYRVPSHEGFALLFAVSRNTDRNDEDVQLDSLGSVSKEEVRSHLVEAMEKDIEIERVSKDQRNKPWVFNLFNSP